MLDRLSVVAWVLKVKQVDYELVLMNFGSPMFKSPEFLAMNPNGFVPVLQDDDFALFEGCVVMRFASLRSSTYLGKAD